MDHLIDSLTITLLFNTINGSFNPNRGSVKKSSLVKLKFTFAQIIQCLTKFILFLQISDVHAKNISATEMARCKCLAIDKLNFDNALRSEELKILSVIRYTQ